jgi:hypothetical protein
MSFTPSTTAQSIATSQGNNLANLATPLTGLQSAIAGGNLGPAAMIDPILSYMTTVSVTAPSLLNSWTNFGGAFMNVGYWKDAVGIVHIRGTVKSGTINTVIFQLPAGFRPSATVAFPSSQGNNVGFITGYVSVDSSGNVTQNGATSGYNASLFLDGITFLAEL